MTKKIISIIVMIMIVLFILKNYSNAASATIQCNSTVEVNTPISISVSGSAVMWNLILKVNGQTIATSSELENVQGNKTISFSGNYTPTSEGNLTVTLEGSITEASNGSTLRNFSPKTIKVTKSTSNGSSTTNSNNNSNNNSNSGVQTTNSEKSNIATLSNLGITPNDFSGFKANTYSYNVQVPNNIETIQVYANKGQSGQTISGTGKKTLKEGTNAFNVVVTAEDGKTKKTYTINVTRKEKEGEENPTEEPEENTEENPTEEVFGLTELKIEGIQLEPEFQTDVYEYKIELKEDIDKLDLTTLATEVGADVEITGNENLQEGENIITIIVKGDNEGKTTAYQIIVNKIIEEKQDILDEEKEKQDKIKRIIIISVSVGIILIILIICIIVKSRKSKNINNDYISYENVMDSYNDNNKVNDEIKEDEIYIKDTKKKKRSKGKRFK